MHQTLIRSSTRLKFAKPWVVRSSDLRVFSKGRDRGEYWVADRMVCIIRQILLSLYYRFTLISPCFFFLSYLCVSMMIEFVWSLFLIYWEGHSVRTGNNNPLRVTFVLIGDLVSVLLFFCTSRLKVLISRGVRTHI